MTRADDEFGRLMDELAREGDFKHWRLTIRRTGEETQTHLVFGRGDGEGEVCLTFMEGAGESACRTRMLGRSGVEADNDDRIGSGPGQRPAPAPPRVRARHGD